MDNHEFDKLLKNLKLIIRTGQIDEYFRYNPFEFYNFSDNQSVQIIKCINAEKFVRACKIGLGIPIDYSNGSVLTLDLVVSQMCAIDMSVTSIENRLIDDISNNPEIIRYIPDQSLYHFFCCISSKFEDILKKAQKEEVLYSEISIQIDDSIILETISLISDYLGEVCIENYGGRWDTISTMELGDCLGIILPSNQEVSFFQSVYNRFYKSNLLIGAMYSFKTGFDYVEEMKKRMNYIEHINTDSTTEDT
jgi:hypothetical protein